LGCEKLNCHVFLRVSPPSVGDGRGVLTERGCSVNFSGTVSKKKKKNRGAKKIRRTRKVA
jgi:hypothetical protein